MSVLDGVQANTDRVDSTIRLDDLERRIECANPRIYETCNLINQNNNIIRNNISESQNNIAALCANYHILTDQLEQLITCIQSILIPSDELNLEKNPDPSKLDSDKLNIVEELQKIKNRLYDLRMFNVSFGSSTPNISDILNFPTIY